MILGTHNNRKLKVEMNVGLKFELDVDSNKVSASRSEKLLGVVCNDNLTWKNHLYGDNEISGLICELSKRIGILKHYASIYRMIDLRK